MIGYGALSRAVSRTLGLSLCILLLPAASLAQSGDNARLSQSLQSFLLSYVSDSDPSDSHCRADQTTRVTFASTPLLGRRGEEIIVYISGTSWCGSGGCTLLVLQPKEESFNVIGRTTIVKLPVRALSTFTAGHPDLGVWVQGGGIMQGYEATLRFNGSHYPENPSMPPATRTSSVSQGVVLISSATEGVLLHSTKQFPVPAGQQMREP